MHTPLNDELNWGLLHRIEEPPLSLTGNLVRVHRRAHCDSRRPLLTSRLRLAQSPGEKPELTAPTGN